MTALRRAIDQAGSDLGGSVCLNGSRGFFVPQQVLARAFAERVRLQELSLQLSCLTIQRGGNLGRYIAGRGLDGRRGEMGVPGGGLNLRVPE